MSRECCSVSGGCGLGIERSSCPIRMRRAMEKPGLKVGDELNVTLARSGFGVTLVLIELPGIEQATASTETDYGAIKYPDTAPLYKVPEVVRKANEYRVVSESEHDWTVELRYLGSEWQVCQRGFVNQQSAWSWLEETNRIA